MASEIPKTTTWDEKNNLFKIMEETTWINYLPQQLVSWSQIFWTINSQAPTRPTCAWQLKGSVTVGKERCGALTNTGTCIFWGAWRGGGDIQRGHACLRVVDIWYECMNASVDGRFFCWRNMFFSGCYHLFLGWRTEELHINRCMLSVTFQSFRNCSYKLDPRVYGVLSWQPLVSFYLAME